MDRELREDSLQCRAPQFAAVAKLNAIGRARAYLAGNLSLCPRNVVADLLEHIEQCALLGGTRAPAAVAEGWQVESMRFLAEKLRARGDDLSTDAASWLEKFAAAPAPAESEAAEDAIDAALEIGWRAGVTCSANVCCERSDRERDNDGNVDAIAEAAECRKDVARWLDPAGQTMDELRAMFRFRYVSSHFGDPRTTESKPAEPVVDEAMVERALRAYFELGGNFWHAVWTSEQRRLMRRALEAALRGDGVSS